MSKLEKVGNAITWLFLAWAFIWICLWGIPGIVDLCSKHEAQRAGETRELVSPKLSKGE